jgi:hypothetical protein
MKSLSCEYNSHTDKLIAITMKSGAKEQILIQSRKFLSKKRIKCCTNTIILCKKNAKKQNNMTKHSLF